jgi:3-dehydroquinate synthase
MLELNIKVPGTAETTYKVTIGSDILPSAWSALETAFAGRHPFVVTDENVVAAGLLGRLVQDRHVPAYVIRPAGEPSKNIGTVVAMVEAMEKAYLGRDALVIALGGGTVGDGAGFAAVYIDVATLLTLDERQYRSGLVESVKHGLIADREYFEFLESRLDALLARDADVLQTMARYNCTIKGTVVAEDQQEKNKRRILNYGHTIGHAVEAASGYQLLHGEAVAIGILAAGRMEAELGLSEPGRLDRIRSVLEKLGVPVKLPPTLAEDRLIDIVRHDKKAVDRWPRFVLLERIGQVHCEDGQYAVPVRREIVETVLRSMTDDG